METNSRYISGISISGGEPMLQVEFLIRLFNIVKRNSNLSTLIETNGFVGPIAYNHLFPFLDMALVDLKCMDSHLHHRLTGKPLKTILESIKHLHEHGKLHAVQQVIVPGFTDKIEQIRATARFLNQIDPMIPLRLLRFRPHGTFGEAQSWASPSDQCMNEVVLAARDEGLKSVTRSL